MLSWLRKNWGEVSFFALFSLVLTTDLRLPVVSTLQRGLLATGLWQPALPVRPALGAAQPANYRLSGASEYVGQLVPAVPGRNARPASALPKSRYHENCVRVHLARCQS
jgi:hypothetical protein